MNAKKKGHSPLTPTYPVTLSTHYDLEEDDRPVYVFRAATIRERQAEQIHRERIFNIEDEAEDSVDVDKIVLELIPLINARLVQVAINGEDRPEEMDLEDRLDVSSIIELFTAAVITEIPTIAQKKRLSWLLSTHSKESAQVATDAPESSTSGTESLNFHAQVAADTDAENATTRDTLN